MTSEIRKFKAAHPTIRIPRSVLEREPVKAIKEILAMFDINPEYFRVHDKPELLCVDVTLINVTYDSMIVEEKKNETQS